MTILINQTPVEFTLEAETTVGHVARALQDWAQSQGLALVSVLADGRADLDDLGVDDVEVLAAEAVPQAEVPAQRAEVLAGYFGLVAEAAKMGSAADLATLAQEFPLVQEGVRDTLGPEALASPQWNQPWTAEIAPAATSLVTDLQNWLTVWKSPEASLKRAGTSLSRHLTVLSSLASWFQQGEDARAFDAILGLFTRVEDVRRAASSASTVATQSWNQALDEISPFLQEIRSALDAQDYILLTDLLEYEVVPRLTTVLPALEA